MAAVGLAAVLSAIALAGPGLSARAGQRDTAAAAFAVRTVRLLVANHYAAAWRSLHPSHQRAIGGRATYVRCELTAPVAAHVAAVEALGVRDEIASIAGVGRVRTKAVAIQVTFTGGHEPEGATVMLSVHVLLVDGTWRWVLPNSRYASYRDGGCG
jgi:hypothetical protein